MGTGLIYAAIVAAWAVYLVPLWLRRNDEAQATRAGDPIPATSRVLTRRGQGDDTQEDRRGTTAAEAPDAAARTEPETEAPTNEAKAADETADDEIGSGSRDSRDSADAHGPHDSHHELDGREHVGRSAPARRRRTLLVLVLATTVVAVLGVVGVVPGWALAIPGGLVLGFALLSASVARRERRQRLGQYDDEDFEADEDRAAAARRRTDRVGGAGSDASRAPAYAADGGQGVDGRRAEGPAATRGGASPVGRRTPDRARGAMGEEWDPVSVPLPTYVTKAKAPRTVRTIDLSEPGTYSSGRYADGAEGRGTEQAAEPPAPERAEPKDYLFDQEQVRPAVGD